MRKKERDIFLIGVNCYYSIRCIDDEEDCLESTDHNGTNNLDITFNTWSLGPCTYMHS